MKLVKILLPMLLALVLIASCKKNDDNDAFTGMTGYWSGAFGDGNEKPTTEMAVVFRANGTSRTYYGYTGIDTASAYYKLEGTYTFENKILRFNYTENPTTFIHQATVSSNSISGTWGFAPSVDDGGKFILNKRN